MLFIRKIISFFLSFSLFILFLDKDFRKLFFDFLEKELSEGDVKEL